MPFEFPVTYRRSGFQEPGDWWADWMQPGPREGTYRPNRSPQYVSPSRRRAYERAEREERRRRAARGRRGVPSPRPTSIPATPRNPRIRGISPLAAWRAYAAYQGMQPPAPLYRWQRGYVPPGWIYRGSNQPDHPYWHPGDDMVPWSEAIKFHNNLAEVLSWIDTGLTNITKSWYIRPTGIAPSPYNKAAYSLQHGRWLNDSDYKAGPRHIFERSASAPASYMSNQVVPVSAPAAYAAPAYAQPLAEVLPEAVPFGMLAGYRAFRQETDPDPDPQPMRDRDRPVPPGIVVEVPMVPGGRPRFTTPRPVRPRRPRPGERESKTRVSQGTAWQAIDEAVTFAARRVFDGVTEALDFLDAVYYSIPRRDSDLADTPWHRFQNAPRPATPQEKVQYIYENADRLDFRTLMQNIVLMELQDRAIGDMSRQAMQNLRDAGFTGNFFGPAL